MNSQFVTPEDIVAYATKCLGTDASPRGEAPNELACVESCTEVLVGAGCMVPILINTPEFKHFLTNSLDWERITEPEPGCVILSVTGEGGYGGIAHGHTGIFLDSVNIASNSSKALTLGKWIQNYTYESWIERWNKKGHYPIYIFRKKFIVPASPPGPAPAPVTPVEATTTPPTTPVVEQRLTLWQIIQSFFKAVVEFLLNYF